jgi:hypothetical protein
MPRNFTVRTTLELSMFFLELYLAVPIAIAAYPQYGRIPVDQMEPEIQEWKTQQGKQIKEFMYNKGL